MGEEGEWSSVGLAGSRGELRPLLLPDERRDVSAMMSSRLAFRSEAAGKQEVSRTSVNFEPAILVDRVCSE